MDIKKIRASAQRQKEMLLTTEICNKAWFCVLG
jgi:hypothetical protein